MENTILPQTKESLAHILKQYSCFSISRRERSLPNEPMIVGVSGCQGSGKTTLCDTLSYLLKREPYNLNVVSFSLDDVYLKRQDQVALSQEYSMNKLYQQRGQAGSHDLALATETLKSLLLNQTSVPIPSYDKSLFNGQGDRLAENEWRRVSGPFDIVLFEGWMLGFKPLEERLLEETYHAKRQDSEAFKTLRLEDVKVLNEELKRYETELYPYFNLFIHLSPLNIQQVYQWRLEQEQHMKSTREVSGLSDDAVKQFVDTYMPAYELYLPRLESQSIFDGQQEEANRHLKIVLDRERKVVHWETLQEKIKAKESDLSVTQWALSNRRILFAGCALLIGFVSYRHQKVIDTVFRFYNKFNKK